MPDKAIKKAVIGFDMDGVIIDHTQNKLKIAEKFGYQITPKETPSEIMRKIMGDGRYQEVQYFLFGDSEIALTPPLMPGIENTLETIQKKQIPYFLVSRRREPHIAIELLKMRGVWPKYFNKQNAFFVTSIEGKNIKSKELSITHYIDDEVRVLEKLTDVPNRFLFDCYDSFEENPLYIRLNSWEEFPKKILRA